MANIVVNSSNNEKQSILVSPNMSSTLPSSNDVKPRVKFNEILVDDSSLLPCQDFTSRYILFVKTMDFWRCFSQDFFFLFKTDNFDLHLMLNFVRAQHQHLLQII